MITQTQTLADFLLARIAEDEAADGWHTVDCGVDLGYWATGVCVCGYPARVLAECDAKRRIVDFYRSVPDGMQEHYRAGLGRAVRCLALPYADHADYRKEWKP